MQIAGKPCLRALIRQLRVGRCECAILARYGGASIAPYQYTFILSSLSALFLVAGVYVLGDISAHFNPATTFAFALRRDMGWPMGNADDPLLGEPGFLQDGDSDRAV